MKCKRCEQIKNQVCHLTDIGFFDVNKALNIVKENPRHLNTIFVNRLKTLTRRSKILKQSKKHLKHVDLTKPIIIGQVEGYRFILDGNHRALSSLLKKQSIDSYILTEFETGQTFRRNPPKGKIFV